MPTTIPPYAELLEHIASGAREQLADGDTLLAVAFLIKDGDVADFIGAQFDDDGRSKEGFAELVRQSASKTKPDAIALLSESWTLPPEYSTADVFPALKAQYGEIAAMPMKIDCFMLQLETPGSNWLATAPITAQAAGRSFGPLAWRCSDATFGRFNNLLPVPFATPQQVTAFLELARTKLTAAGIDPDFPLWSGQSFLQKLEAIVRQAPAAKLTASTIDSIIAFFKKGSGGAA